MAMFLNSSIPYESYKEVLLDKYFVDKSMLLEELIVSDLCGTCVYDRHSSDRQVFQQL